MLSFAGGRIAREGLLVDRHHLFGEVAVGVPIPHRDPAFPSNRLRHGGIFTHPPESFREHGRIRRGTRNPFTPSRTTSGTIPTGVATTGRPDAIASIRVMGPPSQSEERANTSIARYNSATSLRAPRKKTASPMPSRAACSCSRASSLPLPTTRRNASFPPLPEDSNGLEQILKSFLLFETAHGPDEKAPRWNTELLPRLNAGHRNVEPPGSTPLGMTTTREGSTPSYRMMSSRTGPDTAMIRAVLRASHRLTSLRCIFGWA